VKVDSPERKAKKQALYGGDYRRRARAVKSSATHCHLCNKPFEYGDTIEADHLIPGNPDSALAPAHRTCNRRRGNKLLPPGGTHPR
jgi:5-methylcytosine-specific restriction endonuclease McrA